MFLFLEKREAHRLPFHIQEVIGEIFYTNHLFFYPSRLLF